MIGRKIQNYKIISLLGEGGMGTVYKALDTHLERYVAIKIVHLNALPNSSAVERFKREARNQAKLSHPNIVSVYGFVEEKDVLGIVMEFIEGETIESIIKNRGRIEIGYAIELMDQILDGIQAAHNQGFIHRDLKPSNIILDLSGNPKIMDFGISKSLDEIKSITQQNARPGTLLYMSPEQLSGNQITTKSDLYALGITFYEMLTSLHPYNASTIYEIIDAHVNKIPEKISNQIESVPILADEIILSAMGKSIINNFSSANDFKNSLTRLKDHNYHQEKFVKPVFEEENYSNDYPKVRSKNFNRVSNILLFILFVGLGLIVYNVVKSIVVSEEEKTIAKQLSYSQEYSVNPNSLNSTDWSLIKLETSSNINSISFFDDYNGYLAGDSGLVMQTSDGGISWKKNKVDFNSNLNSTFLIDDRLFFAGSAGFVGYLNRNSKKISKIQLPTSESIFKIFFKDHSKGFVVGSNGTFFKSNDGGLTWSKGFIDKKENLFSINFSDSKNGFIVGWNGLILKSNDEGINWQPEENFSTYLKDVLFVNEFLGFIIGGNGLVLRTENGDDWEEVDLETKSGLYKIKFVNSDEGMILSNRGEVFFTYDAGKNWVKKYIGAPLILNDIHKLNSGNFLIACNNGNLIQSKIKVR